MLYYILNIMNETWRDSWLYYVPQNSIDFLF